MFTPKSVIRRGPPYLPSFRCSSKQAQTLQFRPLPRPHQAGLARWKRWSGSHLNRGRLCVGRRKSRRIHRSCRRSSQTRTRSTDTGCSYIPLVHCRPACPLLPGRRSGIWCWPLPPGTHTWRPGSPAHSDRCHNYRCLEEIRTALLS